MKYRYELSRRAERYFRRLDPARRRQIHSLIGQLRVDPFDQIISAPLHGAWTGCRRSRLGDLRLVYEVHEDRLVVYILRIGPRGDVYRG